MSAYTDFTFITNENEQSLLNRLSDLLKNTRYFDVLVGYFFISGFHKIQKHLENVEKIRILIGINADKKTIDIIQKSYQNLESEYKKFSHAEVKQIVPELVINEIETSDDELNIEKSIRKFVEWIKDGKLEIRSYPSQKLHAKLYIMTFKDSYDVGRVITGSSNFTQHGLEYNLEFNVELKNRSDYEFAKSKFESLWENSVEISDIIKESILKKTWLNDSIMPYHLYLKFLYEYFQNELSQTKDLEYEYLPNGFKKLEYQEQAVLNAKRILEEYGGVFISDVVGLGKTYMCAMLAKKLDGRTLIIAPPHLLDKNNPGSWTNVFYEFNIAADTESIGKLDHILKRGIEKYKNIIIDEAHRFRTETNKTYEMLSQICRGKRVILVTATPYNNTPSDILSQIKLFQNAKKSTIPNLPNIEAFIKSLEKRLKTIDRKENKEEYIKIAKDNSKQIREKILKYLMVRRTRSEIEKYFQSDLKRQNIKFPKVDNPTPVFYQLNEQENEAFQTTIHYLTKELKYARYKPTLYYIGKENINIPKTAVENLAVLMKILLIKRLESSFFAFNQSLHRFIEHYKLFLKEFNNGNVYISKDYSTKIFELIESNDFEKIEELIFEGKAQRYPSSDFEPKLKTELEDDLKILENIKSMWKKIKRDPKLECLIHKLTNESIFKENKFVIFTESKETANYLHEKLNVLEHYKNKVLVFTGSTSESIKEKVIENFDANYHNKKDDFQVLITTEVLAEGVNLHRSNIVINYDIPWNPTRLMQRVGRINRVGTQFDKIHIFNLFPSEEVNNQIKLKEAAIAKINAFISLLGTDAKHLTEEEEITSHELFNKLISKKTITGEDDEIESELKYLNIIKEIRDNNTDLFNQIKSLPKKARSAKSSNQYQNHLLTYFKKGKLHKFYIVNSEKPQEVDFITAAKILECSPNTPKSTLPADFYTKLEKNKEAFIFATTFENLNIEKKGRRSKSNVSDVLKFIKIIKRDTRLLTDEQISLLNTIYERIEAGSFPKKTIKDLKQKLSDIFETSDINDTSKLSLKLFEALKNNTPSNLLKPHISEISANIDGPREVILSMYLS